MSQNKAGNGTIRFWLVMPFPASVVVLYCPIPLCPLPPSGEGGVLVREGAKPPL